MAAAASAVGVIPCRMVVEEGCNQQPNMSWQNMHVEMRIRENSCWNASNKTMMMMMPNPNTTQQRGVVLNWPCWCTTSVVHWNEPSRALLRHIMCNKLWRQPEAPSRSLWFDLLPVYFKIDAAAWVTHASVIGMSVVTDQNYHVHQLCNCYIFFCGSISLAMLISEHILY